MSLTPVRSYTRLAIAIVIAAVVVAASILSYSSFETTVTRTVTSTVSASQETTCPEPVSNATSAFATDCQLGITLGIGTGPGPSLVYVGFNETFHLSLTSDLALPRNVSYTGFPTLPHGPDLSSGAAFDYVLPLQPSCGYPPTSSYEPAFMVIYNATGSPMQLSDSPLADLACLSSDQNYHIFSASQTLTKTLSIGGYWTSTDAIEPWINATYSQFNPGNYTAVAFDPWGQLVQLNFSVSRYDNTATTISASSSTGASTSSSTRGVPTSISGATTDPSLGLRLGLHISVNATGALSIETNESNLLDRVNNVTTASDWPYPSSNSLPCGDFSQFPIQYAVLQGYYGTGNYTSASALALYDPTAIYPCPTITAPIPYLLFSPLSDNASISSSSSEQGNSYLVSADYSVTGYWTDSGTFHPFPPGVYTTLVEDEWGDVVLLHFTEG